MSYTIDRYQSNNLQPGWPVTIPEGSINATSTSLRLPGRGIPNYGEMIAENFVHILENFAGPEQPLNPIIGQIWYDVSSGNLSKGILKVYNGVEFVRISGVEIDQLPFYLNNSSGKKGDLRYYDSGGKGRLYIHNGVSWQSVSGVSLSSSNPSNSVGNDGDMWFNTLNEKFFIKVNGIWLNFPYLSSNLNYDANIGAILVKSGSLNFVVIFSEGNVVAIFSYSNISASSLPTNFILPDGVAVNLQLLFPNGISRGMNFSNINGNSLRLNPQNSDTFTISSGPGKLLVSGPNNNNIEFDNTQNRIIFNAATRFDTTNYIKMPSGTTGQRPSSPEQGYIRYNTTDNDLEYYDGISWVKIATTGGGGSSTTFPSGTRLLFYQNSAPAGWFNVTGINDSLVRIVDSGGGSLTSGNNFSSVNSLFNFTITGNTNDHTLTINQMPLHGHPYVVTRKTETTAKMNINGGIMMRDVPADFVNVSPYTGTPNGSNYQTLIGGTGGNQPHKHGISLATSFSLNIKYINVIVCQKT